MLANGPPLPNCPAVREVLRGLPFLQQVSEPVFDALLERGQLIGAAAGVPGSPGRPVWKEEPMAAGPSPIRAALLRCGATGPWQPCSSTTGREAVLRSKPSIPHCCPTPFLHAEFCRGEVIWAPAQAPSKAFAGLHIVIYGLVRHSFTGGPPLRCGAVCGAYSPMLVGHRRRQPALGPHPRPCACGLAQVPVRLPSVPCMCRQRGPRTRVLSGERRRAGPAGLADRPPAARWAAWTELGAGWEPRPGPVQAHVDV